MISSVQIVRKDRKTLYNYEITPSVSEQCVLYLNCIKCPEKLGQCDPGRKKNRLDAVCKDARCRECEAWPM